MYNSIYQSNPDPNHRRAVIARWLGNETDIAYLKVAEQLDRIFHENALSFRSDKAVLPISDSFMRKACGVQGGRNTPRTFNWITVRDQAHHRLKRAERGGARGTRSESVSQYAIYGITQLVKEFVGKPQQEEKLMKATMHRDYDHTVAVPINTRRLKQASLLGAANRVTAQEISELEREEWDQEQRKVDPSQRQIVRYSATCWEYRNAAWSETECAQADRILTNRARLFTQKPFTNIAQHETLQDHRVYYQGDSLQSSSRAMREAMLDSFTDIDINAAVFASLALVTDMKPGPVTQYLRDKGTLRRQITKWCYGNTAKPNVAKVKRAINSLVFGARHSTHPNTAVGQELGHGGAQRFWQNPFVQELAADLEWRVEEIWPRAQYQDHDSITQVRFFGYTAIEAALRECLVNAVNTTAQHHPLRNGRPRPTPQLIHMHDGVMVLEPIGSWGHTAHTDLQSNFRNEVRLLAQGLSQGMDTSPREWTDEPQSWLVDKAMELITVHIDEWEDPVAQHTRKTRALKERYWET